jgi:type I restriction enzyme S subunit
MTMNSDWLLKHFEKISEAPDAVPRLRRFILDLAVRGKLVEQNPEDEPAAELLKHAQTNRGHGSNGDKRQNQKLYPPIQADEIAPRIPENWILARVGELLDIQYGKALPAADRSDQGSVVTPDVNSGHQTFSHAATCIA